MSRKQFVFKKKARPTRTMLDQLTHWLVVACGVGIACWGIWQAALLLRRPKPAATLAFAATAANDDASIAAATRALEALQALQEPSSAKPPASPTPVESPSITRQAAKESAVNVRRVANEAKEELTDLGLAETEEAGLIARDWLAGETALSIGSWEAAEQNYYRIVNRIRQLRETVRISRELDASERAVATGLARERDLLKNHGGGRLREIVTLAKKARSQTETDPGGGAKLYQEALIKLPLAIGEARQAERREKIATLLRLAGHAADRGDWAAAATASRAILKFDPRNTAAETMHARAVQGIDTLVDRYVTRQHEPENEAERKADATQIRRGARDGDPLCRLAAALYSRIDPVLADTVETRERYRQEAWAGVLQHAEHGMRTAAFLVARCYEEGFGIARDITTAIRWYRQAAEQGSLAAQNNLAWIYHQGFEGVAQDTVEAAKWYRLAAEQESIPAQCSLAGLLLADEGNHAATAEAVAWYRRAAAKGSALAQCNLGLLLMTGRGVPRDQARAITLFRDAADKSDTLAQFNLGYVYMTGKGVAQDDNKAVAWYRKAAEKGFAAAQRNLGGMYALGRGVARDDAEAAKWYILAAEQGDAGAQCNIGWMYARGVGTAKNLVKAVNWYRRAAEQGHAEALFMLGLMTVEGTGTARDEAQGRHWIAAAAARGLDQAHAWLELADQRRTHVTTIDLPALQLNEAP